MNYKDRLDSIFESVDMVLDLLDNLYNWAVSLPNVSVNRTDRDGVRSIDIYPDSDFHFDPESPRIPDEGDTWGKDDNYVSILNYHHDDGHASGTYEAVRVEVYGGSGFYDWRPEPFGTGRVFYISSDPDLTPMDLKELKDFILQRLERIR